MSRRIPNRWVSNAVVQAQNIPRKAAEEPTVSYTQVGTFLHAALDLVEDGDAKDVLIKKDQELQKLGASQWQRAQNIVSWLNASIGPLPVYAGMDMGGEDEMIIREYCQGGPVWPKIP